MPETVHSEIIENNQLVTVDIPVGNKIVRIVVDPQRMTEDLNHHAPRSIIEYQENIQLLFTTDLDLILAHRHIPKIIGLIYSLLNKNAITAAAHHKPSPAMYFNLQNIVKNVFRKNISEETEILAEIEKYIQEVYRHERDHIYQGLDPELKRSIIANEVLSLIVRLTLQFLNALLHLSVVIDNPNLAINLFTSSLILISTMLINLLHTTVWYHYFNIKEIMANRAMRDGENLPDIFTISIVDNTNN